jgi:hypothetical protein
MRHAAQPNTGSRWRVQRRLRRCALLAGLITVGSAWPCLVSAVDPPDPLEITIGILEPHDAADGIVNRIPLPPASNKGAAHTRTDGEPTTSDPASDPTWRREYSQPYEHSPNEDYSWQPPERSPPSPPPPLLPPPPG